MFRFFILSIATLCITTDLNAKIIDVPTTAEALAEVDADTVLIFDLDNTIVMPAQTLGGEEWFDYLVAKKIAAGTSQGQAVDEALAVWNAVMEATKVVPVEKDAPRLIEDAQKLGAKTMALTARPGNLAKVTHQQLISIGIDLGKSPVYKQPTSVMGGDPAPFRKSVVFVGAKNNKGDILVKFLAKIKLTPKKIVFVDNKMKHVEAVEKALEGSGIEYVGVRLGASDAKIAAFDPDIADLQHRFFQSIVSNAEAEAMLKAGLVP